MLRDKLGTEAEIDKNYLMLNQLKEKIGDMKAKLPSLKDKENLVNFCICAFEECTEVYVQA